MIFPPNPQYFKPYSNLKKGQRKARIDTKRLVRKLPWGRKESERLNDFHFHIV